VHLDATSLSTFCVIQATMASMPAGTAKGSDTLLVAPPTGGTTTGGVCVLLGKVKLPPRKSLTRALSPTKNWFHQEVKSLRVDV